MPRESPVTTRPDTVDLFGRTPVAAPYTIFDAQHRYDLQPLLFYTSTSSGGSVAHDPNGGAAILSVTSAVGSRVVRQSRLYCPYEPGMVQKCETTGSLATDAIYTRSRYGYFDDANGCYLERGPDGEFIVSRSSVSGSVVETRVQRAKWNGVPVETLDLTLSQIFVIQLQYLGVGSVLASFSRSSEVINAHRFVNDNVRDGAYWTTATLPVRYEIETVAAGGSGAHMHQVCCSVKSEGGFDPEKGFAFAAANIAEQSVAASATVFTPILSIRPKLLFGGLANRMGVRPLAYDVSVTSNDVELALIQGGTLTGASWTVPTDAQSGVEADEDATAITGGTFVDRRVAAAASPVRGVVSESDCTNRRWLTTNIAASDSEILTIAARGYGAASCKASVRWLEVR